CVTALEAKRRSNQAGSRESPAADHATLSSLQPTTARLPRFVRKQRRKLFSLSLHRRALVLIHRLDGQDYADDGAAAQFAFRFDVAAVELGNVFDNGQAETGATQFAAAGLVRAKESFEDTRQVLFADPNSFILDAQDNLGVATFCLQPNLPVRSGIFQGVFQQVVQDLLQARFIGAQRD